MQLFQKRGKNLLATNIDVELLGSSILDFEHFRDTNRIESMFMPVLHKLLAQPLCCTFLVGEVPTDIVSLKLYAKDDGGCSALLGECSCELKGFSTLLLVG